MATVQLTHTGSAFSLRQWLTTSSRSRDITFIFFIVLGVLFFRRPDAFYNPQLWSEDGTIYLAEYENNGIKSLFAVDQYFLLAAHLFAVLFGLLSINLLYIPFCYNMTAFFVTFFVATTLWQSANYMNIRYKILYATCFLFVPIGPDIFMNLLNVGGLLYLFVIDFLFIGYKHANKALSLIIIFIVSFTGFLTLILSPVIVLIIITERKKLSLYDMAIYFIMFVGAVAALITTTHADIRHRSHLMVNPSFALPPEHLHFLKLITNNISELFFMNSHMFSRLPSYVTMSICIVLFIIIAVFVLISYIRLPFQRKYVLLLAAGFYFGSYIVAFWPNESKLTAFICARYYYLPYACIAWVIILAWDKRIKLWHIALYLLFFLKHYGNMRSIFYDKEWKKQILEYYQGKRDTILINEGGPDWGWQIVLPKKNK